LLALYSAGSKDLLATGTNDRLLARVGGRTRG